MIDVLLSKQFQAEAESRADAIYPNRHDPNAFWEREYRLQFARVSAEYQKERCIDSIVDTSPECADILRNLDV